MSRKQILLVGNLSEKDTPMKSRQYAARQKIRYFPSGAEIFAFSAGREETQAIAVLKGIYPYKKFAEYCVRRYSANPKSI